MLTILRYGALSKGNRALTLIFLTLAAALRPAAGQAPSGEWIPLPGHRTAAAARARDLGRVASSEGIPLTLGLAPRDPAGLDDLLRRQNDPQDPLYHHFLTPAQFAARFSPSPEQYAAVAAFARAQGLLVTGTTPNRLLLNVEAPSATVEAAFGVRLHQLQDAQGRLFHAPDAEPSVPPALASLLTGVAGLDNSAIRRPHLRQMAFPAASALDALPLETGSGPGGGLTPSDIKTAYNLSRTNLTGAGQTLAVFELDGYKSSDISAYESAFSIPSVTLQNVPVDGGPGRLNANGGQAEVTLDIELEIALAPGASKVLVYEGPNTNQGLLDTYNRIATDNLAKQVSTSWGLDEPDTGASFIQMEAPIFQQMAAQGQSVFAAAGDSGAYDNGSTLCVDDPASQPYVTGAGGTTLTTSVAGGPYSRESVWNDGPGDAGGGGISAFWAIPSWQQGVVSAASLGSTTMRNVPDVSLAADPNTGYAVYVQGGWVVYGGTSCAAPLWTAYTALVNQQRLADGASFLGYANPALYAAAQGMFGAGDFHDITSGSNLYYPAVTGYDDATGWGTLNGANLLADLAPPAPTGLTATASGTQISLSWNAVPNAVSYSVLRGASHGGPYASVGTATGATTYTDTNLTPGTTYYYVVTAKTSAATSAASNEASATRVAATATAPTIATAASATPNPVTGTTTALSVLGADAGGEANLTYTWAATGSAPVTFSANGANAAKNATATFTAAGSDTLTVTIKNGAGLTTTSSVGVSVLQTPTTVSVTPGTASVQTAATQQFTATVTDQFGAVLSSPSVTWSVSGGGTVSASGLFTAGTSTGTSVVSAAVGSAHGRATVTVNAAVQTSWLMNDPAIGHVIGRADSGGWSANTGQDAVGFMQYGPYTTQVAPGAHTASWSLMVDNNTYTGDTGPVLELQVTDYEKNTLLAIRDVQRHEWTGAFQYQTFSVPFTLPAADAGDHLEFRVFWFRRSYVREQVVSVQ